MNSQVVSEMGFLDKLFNKQKPQTPPHETELIESIHQVIAILENADSESAEEIIEKILPFTQDEQLAWELYCLIPSACCRLIVGDVTYSNELVTMYPDGSQKTALLSNNQNFKLIQNVLVDKLSRDTDKTKIQRLLFQSAEFNAINQALHNGSALEDLLTGPLVMLAPEK